VEPEPAHQTYGVPVGDPGPAVVLTDVGVNNRPVWLYSGELGLGGCQVLPRPRGRGKALGQRLELLPERPLNLPGYGLPKALKGC